MIGVSYRYTGGHTMREGNKFSIENDSGLWRKKVGAMLGVVASAALAISGCGVPISETNGNYRRIYNQPGARLNQPVQSRLADC